MTMTTPGPGNAEPRPVGIGFPMDGQLRIASTYSETGELTAELVEVRFDIMPRWLAIALRARNEARTARYTNPAMQDRSLIGSDEFYASVRQEMEACMVSITAVAFAIEAFTNSVVHFRPETKPPCKRGRHTAASGRIHQVWQRAFRMSNQASKEAKTFLRELHEFRNEGVHSAAGFSEPAVHPTWGLALDKRFLIFRVENANFAFQLGVQCMSHTASRPRFESDEDWTAYCRSVVEHLNVYTPRPSPKYQ